jgi:hypothetical protein
MSDVPSNLIPTRVTQLPLAPVADENSLMMIVYQGNNYQIRVGDLLSVAGVPVTRQVIAGTGMTGGGQLSSNVTLSIANGGVGSAQLASSGVTPGTYGTATEIPVLTVDDTGRVVAATTIPATVSGYVPVTRQVIAGTGLNGGGALNANVTLNADLSNGLPLVLDDTGSAGVSTEIARADHQHPAVDLSDQQQVNGILPMDQGGTARSLVPNAGAVVWSGADGLYIGPAGVYGQVLTSGGTNQPIWASIDVDVPRPANTVRAGPVSGPDAIPTFRLLVNDDIPDTLDGKTLTNVDINSGTIDGTVIGGTTPAAGTFTTVDTDYVDFAPALSPLPADATGRLYYDNSDQFQTLAFQMNGGVVQHVGEEQFFRVKLSAPATKGQVMMFTGAVGASGGLIAAPATGLQPTQANYILGIADESGTTNDWIFVTNFGEVKNINTTGGAEAWTAGQELYYNPLVAGGLTKTKPNAPNAIATVAAVVHVGTSNGILFVRPTFGSVLGGTDGNVQFGTLNNGDVIVYNTATSRWENLAQSSLSVGSATTATNVAGGGANRLVYNTGSGATSFVTAPTVANTFLEWSGSAFQWASNPLGTVTSVGLSLPGEFTITNSPVTSSGTLTGNWASQTANYIFAAPNGSPGTPTFRAIVAADIPTLNQNTTGSAGSVVSSVTFNSTGGAAANSTFNGSSPLTVDYSTVGAPKADGTGASGTWSINISGNAATATTATSATSATTATNIAGGAAGSIPYQTGAGATALLPTGSGVLVGGTTPSYSTAPSLTGTNFTGIPNAALSNSSLTIGTTTVSLGGTSTTLAGLTSVTLTQDPVSNLQVATKQYVDTQVSSGIHYHQPVRVESPTNLNATYNNGTAGVGATLTNAGTQAALVIDGVTLSVNDRVLIYTQTTQTQNGIYVVTSVGSGSTNWVLTRASDANTYVNASPAGLSEGSTVFVQEGATGAGETYTCTTQGTITFGTTAIVFAQISSAQIYSAGTGLTLSGTQFSLTTPVSVANGGSGLSSYTSGDLIYATGSTTLSKLGIGATNRILTSSGSAPQWVDPSTVTVGSATTATSAGTATSATTATNVAGGGANRIVYNTGAGATSFITAPVTTNSFLKWDGAAFTWDTAGAGTVTSVGMTVPTGLSVSGSPVTSSGTLAVTFTAGYSIPTTASQSNWDTAYTDRLKWDGGSTGLNASTGRTSLGGTTVGQNLFTLTNPSAITFPRFNADNTVSALSAADFRTAIGAGTGNGTVTSITAGTYLTGGTITTSGTLAVDATSANTASKVVARDASGNFSAGTITATLSGNASTATTATNLAGGAASQIPYQSGVGTTTFLANGTSGQVLKSNGASAPSWSGIDGGTF